MWKGLIKEAKIPVQELCSQRVEDLLSKGLIFRRILWYTIVVPIQLPPATGGSKSEELFYYKRRSSHAGSRAGSRAGSSAGSHHSFR